MEHKICQTINDFIKDYFKNNGFYVVDTKKNFKNDLVDR